MKTAVLILEGMFFVGCRDHHESSSVEEAGQPLWIETREVDWNEIQFGGEGSAQWSDPASLQASSSSS